MLSGRYPKLQLSCCLLPLLLLPLLLLPLLLLPLLLLPLLLLPLLLPPLLPLLLPPLLLLLQLLAVSTSKAWLRLRKDATFDDYLAAGGVCAVLHNSCICMPAVCCSLLWANGLHAVLKLPGSR
jgi:hypothetical protein